MRIMVKRYERPWRKRWGFIVKTDVRASICLASRTRKTSVERLKASVKIEREKTAQKKEDTKNKFEIDRLGFKLSKPKIAYF